MIFSNVSTNFQMWSSSSGAPNSMVERSSVGLLFELLIGSPYIESFGPVSNPTYYFNEALNAPEFLVDLSGATFRPLYSFALVKA